MTIIVQAGHKTSKSKQVMEKLYERGLSRPADTYTRKMTPKQVSETLYKVLAREDTSHTNEKIADNVMTDFLLANLDSENWGWEEEKNLFSLDYWQQIDPNVGFVFVFDNPVHLLTTINNTLLTVEFVNNAMEEWIQYHQTMLSFIEKYKDNMILVEGVYASNSISQLSESIKRIASTLYIKSTSKIENIVISQVDGIKNDAEEYANMTVKHISSEILRKYPEAIRVFNLLLSKASIKSSDPIYKTKQSDLNNLLHALKYLNVNKNKNFEILENQNKLLKEKLKTNDLENQKLISQYKTELDFLRKVDKKSEYSIDTIINAESLQKENDLLFEQLHCTQEELEKHYLKSRLLGYSEVNRKSHVTVQQSSGALVHHGAAERIKQDLPYRLGATMISQSKSAKNLASLPLSLAKEYKKFKKSTNNKQPLPKLEEYYDVHEGERVKNHLSYKLGKILVDGLSSPKKLIFLPINVTKEAIKFKNK